MSRLYTFAIMWSIAAVLESDNRRLLEEFILQDLAGKIEIPKLKVHLFTKKCLVSCLGIKIIKTNQYAVFHRKENRFTTTPFQKMVNGNTGKR